MDVSDSDFVCDHIIMSVGEVTRIVAPTVAVCVVTILAADVLVVFAKRVCLYKRINWHPFDEDECTGEDNMTHDVSLSQATKDDNAILFVYEELQQQGYSMYSHKLYFQASVTKQITHHKRTSCHKHHAVISAERLV